MVRPRPLWLLTRSLKLSGDWLVSQELEIKDIFYPLPKFYKFSKGMPTTNIGKDVAGLRGWGGLVWVGRENGRNVID